MSLQKLADEKEAIGSASHKWWCELQQDSSARARLRRAATLLDLVLEPEIHQLRRYLQGLRGHPVEVDKIDKVALIAGVLAYVKEESEKSLGAQLGQTAQDRPAIEPRLRQLLRVDWHSNDELLPKWRRMLTLLDGKVNILALSVLLFNWGDWTKKVLASEFYENFSSEFEADSD